MGQLKQRPEGQNLAGDVGHWHQQRTGATHTLQGGTAQGRVCPPPSARHSLGSAPYPAHFSEQQAPILRMKAVSAPRVHLASRFLQAADSDSSLGATGVPGGQGSPGPSAPPAWGSVFSPSQRVPPPRFCH